MMKGDTECNKRNYKKCHLSQSFEYREEIRARSRVTSQRSRREEGRSSSSSTSSSSSFSCGTTTPNLQPERLAFPSKMRLPLVLLLATAASAAVRDWESRVTQSPDSLAADLLPPLHPNCSQSLTDLLLLRQEIQLNELSQTGRTSVEVLKEAVTILRDIRGSEARTPTAGFCPHLFEKVRDSCVMVGHLSLTWEHSRTYCRAHKGDLMTFSDVAEFEAVVDYIKRMEVESPYLWIGGSDSETEGDWKWTTGADMPMGPPLWGSWNGSQEPNGKTNEQCAALEKVDNFLIHDIKCDGTKEPLCKASLR